MNKIQKIILAVGVALFGMSELMRPWYYEDSSSSAKREAGYHLFNSTSERKSPEEFREIFQYREKDRFNENQISLHPDRSRLGTQRIALILFTISAIIFGASQKSRKHWVFAILSLFCGLFFFSVFVFHLKMVHRF